VYLNLRRAVRRGLPGLAALALGGCAAPGDADVLLGTGEAEWVPLHDGDEIEVVFGPQGGFHVLGAIRIAGLDAGNPDLLGDPRNPTVAFDFAVGDESLLLSGSFTQGIERAPEDAAPFTHELVGRRVILDIDDEDPLIGEEATLDVTVADVDGASASCSLRLVAAKHPFNP
jgi:hypothetical protein